MPILQAFLDREIPRIDLEPENPFFSEKRARMSFTHLCRILRLFFASSKSTPHVHLL
jgi:hypothetical protein